MCTLKSLSLQRIPVANIQNVLSPQKYSNNVLSTETLTYFYSQCSIIRFDAYIVDNSEISDTQNTMEENAIHTLLELADVSRATTPQSTARPVEQFNIPLSVSTISTASASTTGTPTTHSRESSLASDEGDAESDEPLGEAAMAASSMEPVLESARLAAGPFNALPDTAPVMFKTTKASQLHPLAKKRGGNLPKHKVTFLHQWFEENHLHPYPTEVQKQTLCHALDMGLKQVNNWFINARRRKMTRSGTASAASSAPASPAALVAMAPVFPGTAAAAPSTAVPPVVAPTVGDGPAIPAPALRDGGPV